MYHPLTNTDLLPVPQEHELEVLEQVLPSFRSNGSVLWYIPPVPLPCSQDVRLDNESALRPLRQGQSQMQCSEPGQLTLQD